MSRKPVVAGRFYPGDRRSLERDLYAMIPRDVDKVDAIGAVVPHAGYMCSGGIAGKVYARLERKDTYIILGPSHTGLGLPFALSDEPWHTPLGDINVDIGLVELLLGNSELFRVDRAGHVGEHSIEVQLPFLQKTSPGSLIVPITVQRWIYSELFDAARAVAMSVKDAGKKVMIIASSDMTHYESREAAGVKDRQAIEKMLELDAEGLFNIVRDEGISMCGVLPVTVMLAAARELGAGRAELVEYADSGEVTGDCSDVVGYAGIVVS
ncbi:MAG: AmmeMemoRadiSam system protein B [Candidatus Omnitrophica bacterium]|nr:AmmeMemoRadiSam system protein B [Candidatus Omnitrophota bacterium]MBU1128778.1 AmmeMemoRadiSam system protein B [Candidatus Omnitrophota bacterium]MBU1656983.1 AmmeMemoRadiSam system protein B [Candidatus Omnitrophota bacterium]MBU1785221.1 AmmeMemoRadiSam system protein B [Candidatus Omnitrophota bacterium]MBU1851229.1 AmmeMemoRadiSam system protein B [Candidatus Omnitrophota bacterium]